MSEYLIDLSKFDSKHGREHLWFRILWNITWTCLARPLPRSLFSGWKRFLLRLFGAKIHPKAVVYSSAKIYYPPFLQMDEYSCLASNVNCYNVDMVYIGAHSTISQGAYISPGSHDITNPRNPMISRPIHIEDQAWIATDAFIGMGVTIGQGAVVGARAAVFKDVAPWTIVGGNPAKFLKNRILQDA